MDTLVCAYCDQAFNPARRGLKYCGSECREQMKYRTANRVLCSTCGSPTGWKIGRVASAICNPCRRTTWQHGSRKGYRDHGCRCDACVAWNRQTHSEYRKQRDAGAFATVACSADDCTRNAQSRSMCTMHYKRWARANGMLHSPSDKWSDAKRNNYHARRARMKGRTQRRSRVAIRDPRA